MTIRRAAARCLLLFFLLALSSMSLTGTAPGAAADAARPPASATPPRWVDSCIYCPESFGAPGEHHMRIDSAGRVHIAYGGDALYYAVQDGARWRMETVDPTPGVGSGASLALDPDGRPMIAYYGASTAELRFAQWLGDHWQIETVDVDGEEGVRASLAVDAAGRPHIAYLTLVTEDYSKRSTAKYAYRDTVGWHPSVIGDAGLVDSWALAQMSLALSAGGVPHVAYTVGLDLVRHNYLGASGWQSTPAIPACQNCEIWYVALAVDAANRPNLAYSEYQFLGTFSGGESMSLYYAVWDGSTWRTELADKDRRIRAASLVLDGAGQPRLTGQSWPYDNEYDYEPPVNGFAWYGWRDAAGWHFGAVQTGGGNPDLALMPDGTPRIVFFNGDRLSLTRPGPVGGWHTETVDQSEQVGGVKTALDAQGRPYVLISGRTLYLTQLSDGGQELKQLPYLAGDIASLAVDSYGDPHVATTRRAPEDPSGWPLIHVVDYAHLEAGAWRQVELGRRAGSPVIAVDAADRAHYAYLADRHENGQDYTDLRYILNPPAGGVVLGQAQELPGMVLDSLGNPHLSVASSEWIEHRFFDGALWQVETVATASGEQHFYGGPIALDGAGLPAIAYYACEETCRLVLATRSAGGWQAEVIREVGYPRAMVYDAHGGIHFVYSDDAGLHHLFRGCTGWQTELIAASGKASFGLMATPDGRVLVPYVDVPARDARLAVLQAARPEAACSLFLPLILR